MAQDKAPRLAIIGCGAIVQTQLLPALIRIGWKPAVLVDPSQRNLEAVAKSCGKSADRKLVQDWTTAADGFDAAIVAAPHVFHGPLGIALAEAGKHIFMEKPLAVSIDECRSVLAASQRAGTIVSVGLLRRYLHVARWTKALIASGALGTIRRFDVREGFVFNYATSTAGLLQRNIAAGGVLMDTGAHTLDLLLWWLGDVASVDYRDDSQPGGVEADCVIDCKLVSGATGHIELSRSRDLANTCRIEGSEGFVEVHLSRNEVVSCSENVRAFRASGVGPGAFPEQRFPELFGAELADFRRSVSEGVQHGVSGADATGSVELIERCYKVAKPLNFPWTAGALDARQSPRVAAGTRVVVTGATGFIGGRLVEKLLDQGADVCCLTRSFGAAVRLARLAARIQQLDLADATAVDAVVKNADVVFHCAYDPRSATQNTAAMRNLIASCVAHNVKRLVHISTFSVYEPLPDGPLSEQTPDGDRTAPYTRVKLELERDLLTAVREKGLKGTILQPTIVYGPFSKPWTIAPAEMQLYGTVVLPDQGEGLCNAVYVDDLVDAMILAAQRPEAIGERFVISGPEDITWARFFTEIAGALGVSGPAFRPAAQIKKENSGLAHDIKLVAKNPKMIIQIAVRKPALRKMLQSGLDALPKPLYDIVSKLYFGSGERKRGLIHLPMPQLLRLYMAKASVNSGKARNAIGYSPRFDFSTGMVTTRSYLEWAYSIESTLKPPAPLAEAHSDRLVA